MISERMSPALVRRLDSVTGHPVMCSVPEVESGCGELAAVLVTMTCKCTCVTRWRACVTCACELQRATDICGPCSGGPRAHNCPVTFAVIMLDGTS